MNGNIDELIAESESLRNDLLRTIGKLETFSAVLMSEAEKLRNEVTPSAGHSQTEADSTESSS